MRLLDQAVLQILAEGNKNSGCNPAAAKKAGNVCGRPPKKAAPKPIGKKIDTIRRNPNAVPEWMKEVNKLPAYDPMFERSIHRDSKGYYYIGAVDKVHKKGKNKGKTYKKWGKIQIEPGNKKHSAVLQQEAIKKKFRKDKDFQLFLEAMNDWGSDSSDIRSGADRLLKKGVPAGGASHKALAEQHADVVLQTMAAAPMTKKKIYRGTDIPFHIEGKKGAKTLANVLNDMAKKGKTIDLGMASFTLDLDTAEGFISDRFDDYYDRDFTRGTQPVRFELAKGIKGVKAAAWTDMADEMEMISGGRFKVKGARYDAGEGLTVVKLEQQAVFVKHPRKIKEVLKKATRVSHIPKSVPIKPAKKPGPHKFGKYMKSLMEQVGWESKLDYYTKKEGKGLYKKPTPKQAKKAIHWAVDSWAEDMFDMSTQRRRLKYGNLIKIFKNAVAIKLKIKGLRFSAASEEEEMKARGESPTAMSDQELNAEDEGIEYLDYSEYKEPPAWLKKAFEPMDPEEVKRIREARKKAKGKA